MVTFASVGSSPLSFWHDTLGDPQTSHPPLNRNLSVDVAIVGGGYTALWTALYLKEARPDLQVAILEAEFVGYGASGRNGGWISSIFPASFSKVASISSVNEAHRLQHCLNDTVVEILRKIEQLGIECDSSYAGSLSVARNEAQWKRAQAEVSANKAHGFDDSQLQLLSSSEMKERIGASDVLGGTYSPHLAVVHPAKLVSGLLRAVEHLGVEIYEHTRVEEIRPRRLKTQAGYEVSAETIVVGTEAYTCLLPGKRRQVIPMQSLMIATEPLSTEQRENIGLQHRESFADKRHARIYGQVTTDNRIAFGGRGAPYHFGSKIASNYNRYGAVYDALERSLKDYFPLLQNLRVTHRWGGPFAIPRDWFPGLNYDPADGIVTLSGYVGDGVSTTNLAGRTIRDLLLEGTTALTTLPWVNKRSPRWEPEPLRWLAVNGVSQMMPWADRTEERTGQPNKIIDAFWKVIGQ